MDYELAVLHLFGTNKLVDCEILGYRWPLEVIKNHDADQVAHEKIVFLDVMAANVAAVVLLDDGLNVGNKFLVLGLPFHVLNIERQTIQGTVG